MSTGPDAGALFVGSAAPPIADGDVLWQSIDVALPAGGSVDLPGPPPGFFRIYDSIVFTTDPAATPAVESTVFIVNTSTLDAYQLPNRYSFGDLSLAVAVLTPLGPNEVIRCSLGDVDQRVSANYRDVPSANLTLVRLALTVLPQTVIAAPAPGFYRRWLQTVQSREDYVFEWGSVWGSAQISNRGPGERFTYSLNGVTLCRQGVTAAFTAAVLSPVNRINITAATGPLECLADSAATAWLLGAYEELPT